MPSVEVLVKVVSCALETNYEGKPPKSVLMLKMLSTYSANFYKYNLLAFVMSLLIYADFPLNCHPSV